MKNIKYFIRYKHKQIVISTRIIIRGHMYGKPNWYIPMSVTHNYRRFKIVTIYEPN